MIRSYVERQTDILSHRELSKIRDNSLFFFLFKLTDCVLEQFHVRSKTEWKAQSLHILPLSTPH